MNNEEENVYVCIYSGVFKDMASTCEDVRESDFYKGKLRVLEWINFYFAVVGSGSGIISVLHYIYIYSAKLYFMNGMGIVQGMWIS